MTAFVSILFVRFTKKHFGQNGETKNRRSILRRSALIGCQALAAASRKSFRPAKQGLCFRRRRLACDIGSGGHGRCRCLEQHIKAGIGCSRDEMKKAVECGCWHCCRYDPRLIEQGRNPFRLDFPEPDTSKLMDFLMGESRFAALKDNFPEKADALCAKEVSDVKARYSRYKKMADGQRSEAPDEIQLKNPPGKRRGGLCGFGRTCGGFPLRPSRAGWRRPWTAPRGGISHQAASAGSRRQLRDTRR